MAGSSDNSDVSPSNIIEPTWETLSADEQLQFEEHKEQLIHEVKAKFLANFKVDRNNKVVWQRAIDLALLRPTTNTPEVSDTNELQSLKNSIDEQQDQMQNIIGGIQKDYRSLVRAFDKFTVANFPSHEVELGENMYNSSATSCHDQSQPLYGMPIDTYPEQPQLPAHIGDKLADLRMSGSFACERGPSGLAAVGPIFNELPIHASEPPHTAQTLNYPVGPFTYNDGRSTYNNRRFGHMAGQFAHTAGWSAYLTERSGTEFFDEDYYPNPHLSQLNFPSHYIMHQHHNTASQTHGASTFQPHLEGRKGMATPMSHIGKGRTNGGRQQSNIQTTSPMLDQRVSGIPPAAIDIVREEIAGAF
jgi:hypothetical protein